MRKRTPEGFGGDVIRRFLYVFIDFRSPAIWQSKCNINGHGVTATPGIRLQKRFPMFSGKFNPLLDSYLFRTALTVAGFVAWMAATYLLLSI